MINRQEIIITCAQKLFNEKGYYSISVQDIIDASGISKGTFYNYFHSKKDLVLAILQHVNDEISIERQHISKSGSKKDKYLLMKQISTKMTIFRKYRVFSLYEALVMENNKDLKEFISNERITEVSWLTQRFIDVFGEEIKRHAFDFATAFLGSLHHQIRISEMISMESKSIEDFIEFNLYYLECAIPMVLEKKRILFPPNAIEIVSPLYLECPSNMLDKIHGLLDTVLVEAQNETTEINEMLQFIQKELKNDEPRLHVIVNVTRILSSSSDLPSELSLHLLELLQYTQMYMKFKNEKAQIN
ncbi:TetR/AcrR family transcriptional regulator [Bacillus sp. 1P06AnD]|uniref:TetR/AcrR family transcriptional regulator n=1 Tax=Bacillus sp. 1P06AnD TaxID=3132208 RepID=UPI00399F0B06